MLEGLNAALEYIERDLDRQIEGTQLARIAVPLPAVVLRAGRDAAVGARPPPQESGSFPRTVQHLWRDVYTQWFPANPYRSRPGPEISVTRPTGDGTHADAQLWIPVERTATGG